MWLLLSVGWITPVTAWITWDAFAEYERFDADRTMQAWEVEFRSIEGMSHDEWCGKTASDRARMAKEECGDRFLSFPFSQEDCMFIWSECPRPLLSLPPEGWERFTATAGSIGAYVVERGPAHALWIGIIGLLPPLALLALAVFLVGPLARWVIAGLRD